MGESASSSAGESQCFPSVKKPMTCHLFFRIGSIQGTSGWAEYRLELGSCFVLFIALLGVLYYTKHWNSGMRVHSKWLPIHIWKWALEYSSPSACGRIVGDRVPRAGTEWEAERTSEWLWELHQTLISPEANLEAVNSEPSPQHVPGGPSVPSAPRGLAGSVQQTQILNLAFASCWENLRGFTFCWDGFPE